MRSRRLLLASLLASASLAAPTQPAARALGECIEPVPHAVGVPANAEELLIDLAVFAAGGVTEERARNIVQRANVAYAPLRIRLNPATIDVVDWDSTDAETLMALAAERTGGVRPTGTDAVAVITAADLVSVQFRDPELAGQAKCVGGIRFADQAFLVAEDYEAVRGVPAEGVEYDGFRSWVQASPKALTHELAHLLGAHHHYAHCGPSLAAHPGTLSACSVMLPEMRFNALEFNPVEAAVVRGYAEAFTQGHP